MRRTSPLCVGACCTPRSADSCSAQILGVLWQVPALPVALWSRQWLCLPRHVLGDMAAALGCWSRGGQADWGPWSCLETPQGEGLQNSWLHTLPAMLLVVQEHCLQAIVVRRLTYQEEHVRSAACFNTRHFHHLWKRIYFSSLQVLQVTAVTL